MEKKGLMIILSGCAGVGKDSVYQELKALCDLSPKKIITCTSRPMRSYEEPGRSYQFLSEAQFKDKIINNEMLEWSEVHGNLYGSTRESLEKVVSTGAVPFYIVDVQGLPKLRKVFGLKFRIVSIFLKPPSFKDLEKRMRKRRSETQETIAIRLKTARTELRLASTYDHIVVNADAIAAAREICSIMHSHRDDEIG